LRAASISRNDNAWTIGFFEALFTSLYQRCWRSSKQSYGLQFKNKLFSGMRMFLLDTNQ
jgi:hypothetical protein